MAAEQIQYLKREFLKDKPYNTPNWVSDGIEQTDGFETNGEAQAVKSQYQRRIRRRRGQGRTVLRDEGCTELRCYRRVALTHAD